MQKGTTRGWRWSLRVNYALLELLARNAGRVVTHAQLLKTAWGLAHENDVEYLRVAVRAIRRKLEVDLTKPPLMNRVSAIGS